MSPSRLQTHFDAAWTSSLSTCPGQTGRCLLDSWPLSLPARAGAGGHPRSWQSPPLPAPAGACAGGDGRGGALPAPRGVAVASRAVVPAAEAEPEATAGVRDAARGCWEAGVGGVGCSGHRLRDGRIPVGGTATTRGPSGCRGAGSSLRGRGQSRTGPRHLLRAGTRRQDERLVPGAAVSVGRVLGPSGVTPLPRPGSQAPTSGSGGGGQGSPRSLSHPPLWTRLRPRAQRWQPPGMSGTRPRAPCPWWLPCRHVQLHGNSVPTRCRPVRTLHAARCGSRTRSTAPPTGPGQV